MSKEILNGSYDDYSEQAKKSYNVRAWSSIKLVSEGIDEIQIEEYLPVHVYEIDGNEYRATQDGELVFLSGLREYELSDQVLDPQILETVRKQLEEDKAIHDARNNLAAALAAKLQKKQQNEHEQRVIYKVNDEVKDALLAEQDMGNETAELVRESGLLERVLRLHMEYNGGSVTTRPWNQQGIDFYKVGRNSSHGFYLGIKDGVLYSMSCDEDYYEDDEEPVSRIHVSEIEDPNGSWGYLGHF